MNSLWDIVGHLKDIASIITPIAIAAFGLYINNTVQIQNKLVERRSSLTKQWADQFSNLSDEIYNTTIKIILMYFHGSNHEHFMIKDKDKFFKEFDLEILRIALSLEEQKLHLEKYIDLAPATGADLNQAFEQLHEVARSWFASKGGNVELFRKRQASFNQSARNTHREILELA